MRRGNEERRASKMVKLHSGPINFLLTVGEYIVSGGADGHVRFFDFNFRICRYFTDFIDLLILKVALRYRRHTGGIPDHMGSILVEYQP